MAEDLSHGEVQGAATDAGGSTDTGSQAPTAQQGGAQHQQLQVAGDHQAANGAAPQGSQSQGDQAQTGGHGRDGHVADAGTGQQAVPADHQPGFEVAPGMLGAGAPGGQPNGEVAVVRPQAGETMIYDVTAGEHLAIQFDPDSAIFRIAGNDFVLNFGDGGRIVLADFVDAAQSGHPPVLDIGGQQVVADALLNQALAFNEGLQFPETAAGSVIDGGGHNYSDDFGALINGLGPLGPIGPVSMNFGLIQLKPGGSDEGASAGHPTITVTTETPTPPVTPPDHNPPTGNEPLIVYHGGGFEDAEPNQHIGDTSVHPTQIVIDFHPDGDQVLQTVVISGIPSGATVFCGGTDASHIVDASSGSVTLTAAQVDTGVYMIPPHDSDADIPLHVVGNYISPNGDPQVSADTVFVVDAAADMPTNVSGTADHSVVQEGHPVTVAVHATFGDFTDGSETHYVMVELPSGWTNPQGYATETVTEPNPFNVPAGNYVVVPVDNGTIAAGGGSVTVDVTLGTPATLDGSGAAQTVTLLSADAASADGHGAATATAHTFSLLAAPAADPSVSQTFHLTVIGKSVETTLSGAELTTDNNVSYGPAPVQHVDITVLHPGGDITVTTETNTPPVVPTGDVPGGSTDNGTPPAHEPNGTVTFQGGGFEDAEPNQHVGDTSLHPIHVIPTFTGLSDETLTSLTLSGIPSGATLMVGGQDLAHAVTVTDGAVTLTPAQVASGIYMIPPADSDADIPLQVTGQFVEPQTGATGTVTSTTTAIVDAVADKPTNVSGTADHAAVTEGHEVTFAVHATFGDHVDGSESHFVLVELESGWTNTAGYATETIAAGNTFGVPAGTYVVVPVDNATIGADGSVNVDVTLTSPGHITGNVQSYEFEVVGKAQETTLSGGELTTDNNVSYTPAPAPVDVKVVHPGGDITVTTETNTPPVVPTGDVPGGSTDNGTPPTHEPNGTVTFQGGGFEDAEPNQHVGDTSLHPIHIIPTFAGATDEALTSLTLSGIPSGATLMVGGTDAAHIVTLTNGAVTLTPAQVASGIYMIPPADSDADIPLQVTGQYTEPLTGATGTVSATTTAIVDAVADKPTNVSGTADHAAVTEGHEVTFAVHATFGDFADGSESHSVLVELEAGWTNTAGYATETIAAGNTFGVPAGTYVVVPVDNATIGADGSVTVDVTLNAPGHITGNVQTYEFEVVGKAQETTLSGGELTTDNNVSYTPAPAPVEVKVVHPGGDITVTTETNTPPVVPTGDVPGGSTDNGTPPTHEPNGTVTFQGGGFEDAEPNQHVGDTSLHPIHIIPTFAGVTDEALTSLTLSGIPSGATLMVGGQDLAHAVTVTDGAVTLTPAEVASGIYMIPPADSDADIPLQVTGQYTEPLTGATGTVSATTTAIVDAVADKPTNVSGTPDHSIVQEGHPVTVTVHATFGDFTDGSESHSVLVQIDDGWTNTAGYATETISAGNTFGVPAGTYVVVPVDNASIAPDGSISVDVTLGTPGDIKGSTTYDLNVVGKAQETTLSGAELTTDNNVSYTPSSTPVEIKVSQPPVANPGHDGLYEAGLPDGTDSASGHDKATGYLSVDFNGSTMAGTVTGFTESSGSHVTITDNATSYVVDGGYFIMTVDKATGDYAATLLSNTLDHTGVNLGNDQDVIPYTFTYTVTNADGLTASSTFTLNIADDRPEAYDDTNAVHKGGTVTGNVMDNDQQGADHATVTQIDGHTVNTTGDTTIAGTYGTLTVHADGSYSYTADNVHQGGTLVDQFTYQITDGEGAHGDSATANLDITIQNALPLGAEDHAVVAEAGIDGNAPFHPGTDAGNGSESVTGTLHYDFGADHAATADGGFAWSGTVVASDGDANGAFNGLTSGGEAVQFRVANDGHTIIGYVADSATGPYAGHDVLTLTVDPATGQYTYQQLGPIDHPDSAATVGGNGETGALDTVDLQFGYTVTDADGDTAQGHLTIAVQDDGPIAHGDSFSVHEAIASAAPSDSDVTGNVLANDQFGADGKGDITTITVDGVNYHADGSADTVADHPGGHLVSNDHGELVVQTDQGGVLSFNFDTGDFSYQAPDHMTSATQSESFTYTIRDADGDLSRADLAIDILHQPPTANDDKAQVAAGDNHVGKLVYVIDTSESMGHALGAGTKLAAAKQAFETLNQQAVAAGFGGSEVLIVAFNNGIQSVHQFDHATDAAAIGTYIDSLSANGGTSYEPALSVVSDWLSGTAINSHILGAGTTTTEVRNGSGFDDRVFFLTDGGNNNSAGGFDPSHGSLDNLYSNVGSLATDLHNVTVKTVGFGLDHNSPFYADLDRTDDNIQNGSAQIVDTQDGATGIVGGFGEIHAAQTVTGNVLHNDSVGHDGPAHIVSFVADGQTFTADSAVGGDVISNTHGVITIHTQLGGEFQFNFATGDFSYHAPDAALTSPVDEVFKYTVADALGATSTANLTIEVDPSGNANGDFHLGNLLDWDHAGSAWVGQDPHGAETGMLSTNNYGPDTTHYSASDVAHFLGIDASDLSHLVSQDVGSGSVMKTTLSVDAHSGNDITFDYNFLTDEGAAGTGSTNDFAFAEVNGKLYMLSDAHNDSGTLAPTTNTPHEGFDRSTGWHTATIHLDQSASSSGHVSVAFGVMNAGMGGVLGHDSGLEIDNVHAAAAHAAA